MNPNPLFEAARKSGGTMFLGVCLPLDGSQIPPGKPPSPGTPGPSGEDPDRAIPGPGFASVAWFGRVYHFTPLQRPIVSVLFHAWENGTPCVDQVTLLDHAGAESKKLRDLFAKHPAWGKMICSGHEHGGRLGTFCLVRPAKVV
ncbi:hypothetical protein [Zavarzinella formosa]|uniref:hypothetical protein n=1 Tax=Zavarzinella formosa TaxID=360055 RepID=UPI00030624DB|nr:hypothetical protein [Zavarzinella formosa]